MDVAQEALDKLSAAGLVFREVMGTREELPPVNVASYMGNLGSESGPRGFLLGHDEKDLGRRFDQEWEQLARDSGLFSTGPDGRPEFLLGVDIAQDHSEDSEEQAWRWVRVALGDHWDIAGAGCANGILGAGANNPAFVMMSLDADVVLKGGYYQDGIGASVLRHPGRISELHAHARRIAFEFDWLEDEVRQWAERWVAHVTDGEP